MIKMIFALTILLFISGCDLKQPPKDVDPDTIYDTLPHNDGLEFPYNSTFKYIFDNSLYKQDKLAEVAFNDAFKEKYFSSAFDTNLLYLDNELNLNFTLQKEKNSAPKASKLIQKEHWFSSDEEGNYAISMARCYKPQELNSYTWMQVHGVNKRDANSSIYYNYPLVRLTWERNKRNIYDHIWAVITKSSPGEDEPKIYEWVDLGARPDNFFSAELHLHGNILEVKIEYETKSIQNISYWERVPSYFQVGISVEQYNDAGNAGVAFSELRFENNASNVENITHF